MGRTLGFRGHGSNSPEPVFLARSTDGGDTWGTRQLSAATDNPKTGGRQGCAIRTDSRGTVYVVWSGFDTKTGGAVFYQTRSTDGGVRFERPRIVTRAGVNREKAYLRVSTDGGASYGPKAAVSQEGDRANQPAVAVTPDGSKAYLVYNAFHADWQETTSAPRPMEGVIRTAPISGSTVCAFSTAHRGVTGNARGSSTNSLSAEFLGDYNYVFPTDAGVVAVWNDVRQAADCAGIDAYRQRLVTEIGSGWLGVQEPEEPDNRDAASDATPPRHEARAERRLPADRGLRLRQHRHLELERHQVAPHRHKPRDRPRQRGLSLGRRGA